MKATFVIALLFASVGAIQLRPEDEYVNLQIGVEAHARANVRQALKNELRCALKYDTMTYVRNGPIDHKVWPCPILPSEKVLNPTEYRQQFPSDPTEIQLSALMRDDDDTVEGAREKAAQMQAQLDNAIAVADQRRAQQAKDFENQKDDPASQLQGLMNAQQSLKRMTTAFSAQPVEQKVTEMAKQLGIPMTPELMQLGSNEAISNALVEIAVGMGKTEAEIGAAIGA